MVKRDSLLLVVALIGMSAQFTVVTPQSTELVPSVAEDGRDERAVHLYVVRRNLDFPGKPRVNIAAHSALLLKTAKGDFFLLEYMDDSRAHLNKVTPETKETKDDHLIIKMEGFSSDGMKSFEWTQQKIGSPLDGKQSPRELQGIMSDCMKDGYSEWKAEHCHTAQERVRQRLGLLDSP